LSGSQSYESTRIQKFDPNGQFLMKWGNTRYEGDTNGSDEGEFRFIRAIAIDTAGFVYVGNQATGIQKFDSSGSFIGRINNDGEIGYINAIAVDRNRNVYVATENARIVKYTPAGFPANPLSGIPFTPVPQEPSIGIQNPDRQLFLANAVDAGGARTYYAIETASGNSDTANITIMPRHIPASAVLPGEMIPATAVVAGATATVVAAAAATATGTGLLAQLLITLRVAFEKLIAFARGALEEFILKWLTRINVIKRGTDAFKRFFKTGPITTDDPEKILITNKEILVLIVSPLLLAGAFIFAERTWNLPSAMGIYVVVAAIAMICRDLVQKAVARSFAIYSELRLWSLGTLIMFATGGIFGSVFGSVTRFDLNENLMNDEPGQRRKKIAFVALAGPVMSVILAGAFLFLFPVGGIFFLIGITGFSMNLMSATYSMLPFIPMEGADVYRWRWIVWLLLFIPLILVYMMVITPGSPM
jgi:Zn-dependent protease